MESSEFPVKGVAGDSSRKKAGVGTRWLLTNLPKIRKPFLSHCEKEECLNDNVLFA